MDIYRRIIGYCYYCKDPIYEGERFIVKKGKMFHYDENNYLNNCYYDFNDEKDDE